MMERKWRPCSQHSIHSLGERQETRVGGVSAALLEVIACRVDTILTERKAGGRHGASSAPSSSNLMVHFAKFTSVLLVGFVVSVSSRPCGGDDDSDTTSTAEPEAVGSPTTTAGVQFEADYSSAAGAMLTTTDGQNPQSEGELDGMYSAFGSVPDSQRRALTLRITEDNSVNWS